MKIVAIGGGEIGRPGYKIETEKIDKEILKLTGKKNPKALLIPTASGDSDLYWETFKKYFGKRLGCKIDVLYLIKENLTRKEIKKKVLDSDIIYVGGGDTLKMLKIWKRKRIISLLKIAAKNGTILSGLSAGAVCWFKSANSDSLKFGSNKGAKLIKIKGLGFIPLMACPHYDVEKERRPSLKKMIQEKGGIAIALENCSAIEVVDNKYRIITSSKKANAYLLYRKKGRVIEEKLPKDKDFRSLIELLKR